MKKYILTFLFFLCFYTWSFATWIDHQHFKTGETELNEEAKKELDKAAIYLKEHPFVNIKINGFADKYECKDSLDAIRLGWQRAYNCQYYLFQRGISKCRMPIYSFGKDRPIFPSAVDGIPNENNKAYNRRVETFPNYPSHKIYVFDKVNTYDSLLKIVERLEKEYSFLENKELIIFPKMGNYKTLHGILKHSFRILNRHNVLIDNEHLKRTFENENLIENLKKYNFDIAIDDGGLYIDEMKVDETFNFYVCVLEWTCEE